jgi:YVTN family beta-propeller protein
MTRKLLLTAAIALLASLPARAQLPNGTLLIVCKDENALAIVDAQTLAAVRVPVGLQPHEVAASADGKLAVVTNYGPHQDGDTISVIDLATRKEIHRVSLGDLRGPHGVVFFDGKAWFTVEASKKIARYDTVTNRIDWTHATDQDRTHMLVISRDGHTIYTSNVQSDTVTAISANADKSQWTNTNIPVGKNPEASDLSPDGLELWIGNGGDGTVSIIDTAAKKVVATIPLGAKRINRLKFTPDGKTVLVSDMGSGDVIAIDPKSRKEIHRLNIGKSAEGILPLPDNQHAFIANSAENKIVLLDLTTFTLAPTTVPGQNPDGMAWLPK